MPVFNAYELTGQLKPQIPEDFQNPLRYFHREPLAWWHGHILAYLMRLNSTFEKKVRKVEKKIGFTNSCVGYLYTNQIRNLRTIFKGL
jgi:hypothetical protein